MAQDNPQKSDVTADSGNTEALLGPEAGLQIQLLGDFELRREIGRGGMGTVYEAWQRTLSRVVALKVLGRQVSESPASVLRFQREAQAAAKLHHRNIIPIYQQGEDRGHYYYAMELIDGQSLYEVITAARERAGVELLSDPEDTVPIQRDGVPVEQDKTPSPRTTPRAGSRAKLPPEHPASSAIASAVARRQEHHNTVARHIAAVAEALQYAHDQGVIHRDIKPHNLILGPDDRMMISDFGLARLTEQPGVTITGELIGSPLYMSREQISGAPGRVNHRTDIYSLGATMYEWLTLQPPFPGETRERVIGMILGTEPVPCRTHNPEIPIDLETICLKAMETNPDRRYQRAGDLARDLHRFLSRQPIVARRAGPFLRLGKFVSRHQLGTLATAAAMLALVLGIALVTSQGRVMQQTTDLQQAQDEAEAAKEDVQWLEEDRDILLEQLASYFPVERRLLRLSADAVGSAVDDVVETGQQMSSAEGLMRTGGARAEEAGTPEGLARRAARDYFDVLVPSHDFGLDLGGLTSGIQPREVLLHQARTAEDAQEALNTANLALEMFPDDFDLLTLKAMVCCQMRDYAAMGEVVEELFRVRPDEQAIYVWRGLARMLSDQLDEGLSDFDHALRIEGTTVWPHLFRGLAFLKAARHTEATLAFGNALSLAPDQPLALLGRAAVHAAQQEWEAAVADVTTVLTLDPANADALALRGEYYLALERFAEAAADFRQAIAIAGGSPALRGNYIWAAYHDRMASRPTETTAAVPDVSATDVEGPRLPLDPDKGPAHGDSTPEEQPSTRQLPPIPGHRPTTTPGVFPPFDGD